MTTWLKGIPDDTSMKIPLSHLKTIRSYASKLEIPKSTVHVNTCLITYTNKMEGIGSCSTENSRKHPRGKHVNKAKIICSYHQSFSVLNYSLLRTYIELTIIYVIV